jgi:two-component system, cell cycle response regulator CpdR
MVLILIAEDEEALHELCARALATVTMRSRPHAMAIMRSMSSRARGHFDRLLTDIRMPKMDGIAPALRAARDYPAVTILR